MFCLSFYRAAGTGDGGVRVNQNNPLDLPGNPDGLNDLPEPNDDEDEEEEEEVPVNGPGGLGMMAGGGAGGRRRLQQRDLVDYLYIFMMISFLVLVAYLTRSLGRLLIFAAGVIFMLL